MCGTFATDCTCVTSAGRVKLYIDHWSWSILRPTGDSFSPGQLHGWKNACISRCGLAEFPSIACGGSVQFSSVYFDWQRHKLNKTIVNRRKGLTHNRLGVGFDPPRFFRNNFFIAYCIDMELGIPLRASIWRLLVQKKKIKIGWIFFFAIGRNLWRHFTRFWADKR